VAGQSRANLRDYYAFRGPCAAQTADAALRTPQAVRDTVRAFAYFGWTELYFDPTVTSLDQIDRLAELVLCRPSAAPGHVSRRRDRGRNRPGCGPK